MASLYKNISGNHLLGWVPCQQVIYLQRSKCFSSKSQYQCMDNLAKHFKCTYCRKKLPGEICWSEWLWCWHKSLVIIFWSWTWWSRWICHFLCDYLKRTTCGFCGCHTFSWSIFLFIEISKGRWRSSGCFFWTWYKFG